MQHRYAPYLDNIQTHALAAVGVSHGSFIFHGAECYYTPGGVREWPGVVGLRLVSSSVLYASVFMKIFAVS
jgi:hypothetical protein